MPRTTSKNPGKPGKQCKKETKQFQIRAATDFLDTIDRYVAYFNEGKDFPVATRSSVIKQCLQTGLDAMKKEHPLAGNGNGNGSGS